MNSKEAYQRLLDTVFGVGTVVAEAGHDASNSITGAVRQKFTDGSYKFFVDQLVNRLSRLNTNFPDGQSRAEIIGKISRLASHRNYAGTLAELAVYDYFSALANVEAEVTVPADRTLASLLPGREQSSFDLHLPDFNDFRFDVKSFNDVLSEVVKSITSRVMPLTGVYRIDANYSYDLPYERVTTLFDQIVAGLRQAAADKLRAYQHPELPELRFNFVPNPPPKVTSTEHPYNPERLLEEMRYFVLNHFDQFFREEPNMLVYVVHPWFNLVHNNFTGHIEFYRSYSRNAFVNLAKDLTELKQAIPKKAPDVLMTVGEAVRKLGAIMFLEDRTVVAPDNYRPHLPLDAVRGWLFINKNADPVNKVDSVVERLKQVAVNQQMHLSVEYL